jgi:hypothetical protein
MDAESMPVTTNLDSASSSAGPGEGAALHCSACGASGYYPENVGRRCPVCGGDLDDAEVDDGGAAAHTVEIRLAFAGIACPSCGQMTVVRRDRQCTSCRVPLGEEVSDPTVRQRRRVFKSAIERLIARASAARITNPSFTRRGPSVSPSAYVETVFRPSLDDIPATVSSVKEDAREARWDGNDPASLEAFRRIVASADLGVDMVARLADVLPPIEMRGVHHILTRACGEMVAGHIALLSTVIASDVDDALVRQRDCQRLLDSAAAAAHQLADLVPRLEELNAPGWWMSGTTFDHAAIAWASMREQPSKIEDAAQLVRSTLAQIPGVTDLEDAQAILLLPAAVLPTATADSVVVRERAILARELVDRADREAPGWLADPAELVERVTSGLRELNEQILRLGAAPTGPEFRRNNAYLMANVYATLVEGPLRDLGAVVVIGARAVRGAPNATFVPDVAGAVQAGDVVQELDHLGGSWRDAASMLFRNAAAHADVRVLDDGVELRQVRSENGVVVDEKLETVSDAEFGEEFARLQESMLALQLAVLPWLFTHSDPEIARTRAAVVPTDQEAESTIGLLAGLCGLVGVTIERTDLLITITARPANPSVDVRSPSIPALLPGAFHFWPEVQRITLSVETREPVTFHRAEMPASEACLADENLVAVGLMGRRWQGDCGAEKGIQADLIYVCRPYLRALFVTLQYVIDHDSSVRGLADAEQALNRINSWLRQAALPVPQSLLVGEVRNLLLDAARRLRAMRTARARGDMSAFRHGAVECHAVSVRMGELSEKVTAALPVDPSTPGSS